MSLPESHCAVFIDLENIVFGTRNLYAVDPDPRDLRRVARQYGLLHCMKAYGDFERQMPNWMRSKLDVAGIEAEHYPIKEYGDRIRSSADVHMVLDIIDTALDRPNIDTYILMTGDRDFLRVVNRLRNRLGKRVIIVGVQGAVSQDLQEAADEVVYLEPPNVQHMNDLDEWLIRKIDQRERTLSEGFYLTFRYLAGYVQHPSNHSVIAPNLVEGKLSEFVRRGILIREPVMTPEGKPLTTTMLNRSHPLVEAALAAVPVGEAAGDAHRGYPPTGSLAGGPRIPTGPLSLPGERRARDEAGYPAAHYAPTTPLGSLGREAPRPENVYPAALDEHPETHREREAPPF